MRGGDREIATGWLIKRRVMPCAPYPPPNSQWSNNRVDWLRGCYPDGMNIQNGFMQIRISITLLSSDRITIRYSNFRIHQSDSELHPQSTRRTGNASASIHRNNSTTEVFSQRTVKQIHPRFPSAINQPPSLIHHKQ